jgi:hypothetical protein
MKLMFLFLAFFLFSLSVFSLAAMRIDNSSWRKPNWYVKGEKKKARNEFRLDKNRILQLNKSSFLWPRSKKKDA